MKNYEIKIRKSWGSLNPASRIVPAKKSYNRQKEKRCNMKIKTGKYLFVHEDLFGPTFKIFEEFSKLKTYKKRNYHGDNYMIFKSKDDKIVACDMRG